MKWHTHYRLAFLLDPYSEYVLARELGYPHWLAVVFGSTTIPRFFIASVTAAVGSVMYIVHPGVETPSFK